jgi:hypothetical protein
MKLPVAFCPACRREVLVHRTVPEGADPLTARLEDRCVDCDSLLGRPGLPIAPDERSAEQVEAMGYPFEQPEEPDL